MSNLNVLIKDYVNATDALNRKIDEMFPVGCTVKRKVCGNICTVVKDGDCPPQLIALRHENGNVWWKCPTTIERIDQ